MNSSSLNYAFSSQSSLILFKALFFSTQILKTIFISLLQRRIASTTLSYSFLLSYTIISIGITFSFRSRESVFARRMAETRSGGGGGWFEGLGLFQGLLAVICAQETRRGAYAFGKAWFTRIRSSFALISVQEASYRPRSSQVLRFLAQRRSTLYASPACLRQPSMVFWSSLAVRTRSLFFSVAIPCSLPLEAPFGCLFTILGSGVYFSSHHSLYAQRRPRDSRIGFSEWQD